MLGFLKQLPTILVVSASEENDVMLQIIHRQIGVHQQHDDPSVDVGEGMTSLESCIAHCLPDECEERQNFCTCLTKLAGCAEHFCPADKEAISSHIKVSQSRHHCLSANVSELIEVIEGAELETNLEKQYIYQQHRWTTRACVDVPGWHDIDGPTYSCAWYYEGTRCARHGHAFANKGKTATQACCGCLHKNALAAAEQILGSFR